MVTAVRPSPLVVSTNTGPSANSPFASSATPTKRRSAPSTAPRPLKRHSSSIIAQKLPADTMKRTLSDDDSGSDEAGNSGEDAGASRSTPQPTSLPSTPQRLKSNLKKGGLAYFPALGSSPVNHSYRRGMYISFVENALAERQRGNEASYTELVAQFKMSDPSRTSAGPNPTQLLSWLGALTHVVSSLDRRNHALLIESIISLPWTTMGGDVFARTWTRFVCALCSTRSEWLSMVLNRAVQGLTYRSDWRALAYASAAATTSPSSGAPTRRVIYGRYHAFLRSLLSLIPTMPSVLQPLLLRHLPRKRDGAKHFTVYIRNALQVCEYADELKQGVLSAIISKAIEIDVEIQMDYEELEELEDDEADEDDGEEGEDTGVVNAGGIQGRVQEVDPFDGALDDEDSDDSDSEGEDINLDDLDSADEQEEEERNGKGSKLKSALRRSKEAQARIENARQLSSKLDAIMTEVFAHLDDLDKRCLGVCRGEADVKTPTLERSASGGSLQFAPPLSFSRASVLRHEQFYLLAALFHRSVLPTFKSRNIQFLLFWGASLDKEFSDVFLGHLIEKALVGRKEDSDHAAGDQEEPAIIRVASASYVASMVARAKFVTRDQVRAVVENLCIYLDAYLDEHATTYAALLSSTTLSFRASEGPHAVFYAVAQAVFYIFCFRWRDLRIPTSTAAPTPKVSVSMSSSSEADVAEDEDEDFTGASLRWTDSLAVVQRVVTSPFNPLANCTSAVVNQFASIAQYTGFLYCYSIIERNQRSASTKKKRDASSSSDDDESSASGGEEDSSRPQKKVETTQTADRLDTFFPFDPYRLPCSCKWVDPLYRHWTDVVPAGLAGDDSDSDEDEEDEDEEDDDDDEQPQGLRIPGMTRGSRSSRKHTGAEFGSSLGTSQSASTSTDQSDISQSLDAMSISQ